MNSNMENKIIKVTVKKVLSEDFAIAMHDGENLNDVLNRARSMFDSTWLVVENNNVIDVEAKAIDPSTNEQTDWMKWEGE